MTYLQEPTKPVNLTELARMRADGEKIAVLTCYDASFADLLARCGVDVLLVGDSLGNVLQGHATTLPVTLEHMAYHTACVARGLGRQGRPLLIADMPWGSYQEGPQAAMRSASLLMAAGAQMVKLEGGEFMAETVRFLVERGAPVCAHIGLTPQSVHQLGGYRVQGRTEETAQRLRADAWALQDAGAALIVLEMVPAYLAAEITGTLNSMATIGIGAGQGCNGQVLVLHDMLGVYPGKKPRFVRNFMDGSSGIENAVRRYVAAVKDGGYPTAEQSY
jgi:3-methyl-2-oxobutanoate hydroxymethyltransferase